MNEDKTRRQLINDLFILRQEITKLRKSDIEQKKTIETLKRSEEFFRSIIQHATDIIICEQDRKAYLCKPIYRAFYGI